MEYVVAFSCSFLVSVTSVFFIKKLAWRYKVLDKPGFWRKIHTSPIPLMGGLAIFIGFLFTTIYFVFFSDYIIGKYVDVFAMIGIWTGGALIMVGGFLDDKKNLDPIKQIFFPILSIVIVIFSGVKIAHITNPFGGTISFDTMPFISISLTFLWLLGMSYTTKILDGLDGLTTGITLIGAFIIFLISLFFGPAILPEIGILSIIFAGALFGFWIFNWHKASIFLGEGGSLFCGFMLGVLAIITDGKIAITLLIMGVPIIDLLFVIFRRFIRRESAFSHSDKKHLHFQLLDIGFSHRSAVLFLYFLTIIFGVTGLFLDSIGRLMAFMILSFLVLVIIISVYFLYKKKYSEKLL